VQRRDRRHQQVISLPFNVIFHCFARYGEIGMDAAYTLAHATQGETNMIELESGKALDISLKEDAQGRDRVVLTLEGPDSALNLSPHQARVLATELIMAVNRAEVRNNLRHSHNMVREKPSVEPKRGLFSQAFAK
jgi:hypothetical protein